MSPRAGQSRFGLPGAIAAASGAAALVYQVIWDRLLRLSFGADDLHAVLITSTFLLGLGVGAVLFGRRFRAPFRVYAAVELGIAIFGLCSYPLLSLLTRALGALASLTLDQVEGVRLASVVGVALFLLVPCVLMGGTLPLLFGCFVPAREYHAGELGWLYGASTAGATAGVVIAPVLLLSSLPVFGALGCAAAANALVAVALLILDRRKAGRSVAPPSLAAASSAPTHLLLAFVSGALVLGWELVALRHVEHLRASSPYNFPLVLLLYLAGLALGSLALCRDRVAPPGAAARVVPRLLALAAAALAASVLGCAQLLRVNWLGVNSSTQSGSELARLLIYLALLLMPFAFFQGAVFPWLLRLAAPTGGQLPHRTGPLYLASALGSFVGGLALYFWGWNVAGAGGAFLAIVAVGALVSAASAYTGRVGALGTIGISLVALGLAGAAPRQSLRTLAYGNLWQEAAADRWDAEEGRTGSAVLKWATAQKERGALYVRGKPFGELPETRSWLWASTFVSAQAERARVLLVGLGTGTVLREFVQDPEVRRVDVIDWSEELPLLLGRPPMRTMTGQALDSPKTHLHRADVRTAVALARPASYDVIFESLTHFGPVGSTHYRSREYYREVRRILRPGGVFVVVGVNLDDREVLAALLESFPHAIWFPPFCVIAGAREPLVAEDRLLAVLEARRGRLGVEGPIARHAVLVDRVSFRRGEVADAHPVRDAELFREFSVGPRRLLERLRRAPPEAR